MTWLVSAPRHNPELAIFLTLALGFLIGRLKIGSFSFGMVVGSVGGRALISMSEAAPHAVLDGSPPSLGKRRPGQGFTPGRFELVALRRQGSARSTGSPVGGKRPCER
jgi:hypothetical protein